MENKIKQLEQQLKVEKLKEKLSKEEKALKKASESNTTTKSTNKQEPLKVYENSKINLFQDILDMSNNNIESIMTVVVIIFMIYILFSY